MNYSPFSISHSGQKIAIINRAIYRFKEEHNNSPDRVAFYNAREDLDRIIPDQYLTMGLIWMEVNWQYILDGTNGFEAISLMNQTEATRRLNVALGLLREFKAYQRDEYQPTIRRLHRDRFVAETECEEDSLHNPTYADFKANGLPSKNPNFNPSTNIAYLKRLEKLNVLAEEERDDISANLRDMRQLSQIDSYWDTRGLNLDDLRLTASIPAPPDPLEDYTAYTEVDPDSEVTVATNTITVAGLGKNTDTYVYKNFGAGHFTDFSHLHQLKVTAWDVKGLATPYALADTVNDYLGLIANNFIGILVGENLSANGAFRLEQSTSGSSTFDTALDLTLNVDYYFDTARSGTALTSDIYTDADRTVVFDNLSITTGAGALQYYYPIASANNATTPTIDLISSNTDLQEAAPGGGGYIPFFFDAGHY
jgi:hypothetical protein